MRIGWGVLMALLVVPVLTCATGTAGEKPVAEVAQTAGAAKESEMQNARESQKASESQKATELKKATATSETMTIWIDVRTAEEFAQGHIPGSINIPYEIIGSEIAGITRDVDKDIRVYCRSGRRSGVAMDTLRGMGYMNVINEGGFEDLLRRKAAGEAIP